ncbi:MAG: hypothetical protein ACKVWV_05035 [Planctomycetota bacterium]
MVANRLAGWLVCAALVGSAPSSAAQCSTWSPGFALQDVDNHGVWAFETFDDGSGPALFAAGRIQNAGGLAVNNIAKWNGARWSTLGLGITHTGPQIALIFELQVFDDGTGPALYAAGSFTNAGSVSANNIVKWDGSAWSPLGAGVNGSAGALAIHDDGTGPALYVGGTFTVAGGVPVQNVAKWNGASWSDVGGGAWNPTGGGVGELISFDDGSGSALYACGNFTTTASGPAKGIARWNGTTWSEVGGGLMKSGVAAYSSVGVVWHPPAPARPLLVVSGRFDTAGGVSANNIASWDGSSFAPLGAGTGSSWVFALAVSDLGSNHERLFAGGEFAQSIDPPLRLVAWDGTSWSNPGFVGWNASVDFGRIFGMHEHDDGTNGRRLYVGGDFSIDLGWKSTGIVALDGVTTHAAMATGNGIQVNKSVTALTVHDDGADPALIAGGNFVGVAGGVAPGVARWDGGAWSPMGSGLFSFGADAVLSLATFRAAGGCPTLYAGGAFAYSGSVLARGIARWDGAQWQPLVDGANPGVVGTPPGQSSTARVRALVEYDDGAGARLYAAGVFATAGNLSVRNIVRWDGSHWSSCGDLSGGDGVFAMTVFDDAGPSPAKLIVAGDLEQASFGASNVTVSKIASFDGVAYANVGTNPPIARVWSLAVFDDHSGGGAELYAGGGGFLWKLVGDTWFPVGNPAQIVGRVRALEVHDARDGTGPALYAALENDGASTLLRWDGTRLAPYGGDVDGTVHALSGFDSLASPGGPDLFIGGEFERADGVLSQNIARWNGCAPEVGTRFCFGDGSLPTPCPCSPPNTVPNPSGAADAGCANSLDLAGGRLWADGTLAPDQLRFTVRTAACYGGFTLLVKGAAVANAGIASGDGLRCANGALVRFGGHNAGTNGAQLGTWTYPNDVQTLAVSAVTLQAPGQVAYYQALYRNSAPNFCSAGTYNLTNGIEITWP